MANVLDLVSNMTYVDEMKNPNEPNNVAEILSIPEAARRLGMSRVWLWTEVRAGRIRYTLLGNRFKISSSDLEAYRIAHVVEARS